MASQNPSTVPVLVPSAIPALANFKNQDSSVWSTSGGPVGVSQIVAGSGIAVGPTGGTGVVTVSTVAASPYTVGMIMMWNSLVSIPTGWTACDGTVVNGYTTPNLTNRFVIQAGGTGSAYPSVGLTGGNGSVTLTLNMIPDHTHGAVKQDTASGTVTSGNSFCALGGDTAGISNPGYVAGTPVPTLPPYYSLLYIIYVGVAP